MKTRWSVLLAALPLSVALAACGSTSAAPQGATNDDLLGGGGVCANNVTVSSLTLVYPQSVDASQTVFSIGGANGSNTGDPMAIEPSSGDSYDCDTTGPGVSDGFTTQTTTFPNGAVYGVANLWTYAGGGEYCPNGGAAYTINLIPSNMGVQPTWGPFELSGRVNDFDCGFTNWQQQPLPLAANAPQPTFEAIACNQLQQGTIAQLTYQNVNGSPGTGPVCLAYVGP